MLRQTESVIQDRFLILRVNVCKSPSCWHKVIMDPFYHLFYLYIVISSSPQTSHPPQVVATQVGTF
jgi:hypothetical protein